MQVKEEQNQSSEGLEIESQSTDLLPCPFCKSTDISEAQAFVILNHKEGCFFWCMANMRQIIYRTFFDRWNTRAEDTAALRQRIAELEKALKEFVYL